jgi:hypothetical protein
VRGERNHDYEENKKDQATTRHLHRESDKHSLLTGPKKKAPVSLFPPEQLAGAL